MEEQNNCPKPYCGRPESTSRQHAGKRLSICGNGHSWDQQAIAEQRAKAKEAEYQELAGISYAEHLKRRAPDDSRAAGGPIIRPSGSNPFE